MFSLPVNLALAPEHAASPWLIIAVGLVGLLVGSFLNVVIHRVPRMLERAWRTECAALEGREAPTDQRYNLAVPRSHCPHCNAPVRVQHLVPLLSWLWLKGRCADCGAAISTRYPIIEALTATLFAVCAWRFGVDISLLAALVLTAFLIALAGIDLETHYLPDQLTLPLLWGGLSLSLVGEGAAFPLGPREALLGAIVGYLSLWIVHHLFKRVTGKEGMGYGDFKLLAALGAWLGVQALLPLILFAAFTGAVVGIVLILMFGRSREAPIAFGPYLALFGWLLLVFGGRT
ncbi:MAG: prepilin peptidase [Sinobacteraceae bacterium]|nr:prepilin peptidase [Nevskiaceae bacterium]